MHCIFVIYQWFHVAISLVICTALYIVFSLLGYLPVQLTVSVCLTSVSVAPSQPHVRLARQRRQLLMTPVCHDANPSKNHLEKALGD